MASLSVLDSARRLRMEFAMTIDTSNDDVAQHMHAIADLLDEQPAERPGRRTDIVFFAAKKKLRELGEEVGFTAEAAVKFDALYVAVGLALASRRHTPPSASVHVSHSSPHPSSAETIALLTETGLVLTADPPPRPPPESLPLLRELVGTDGPVLDLTSATSERPLQMFLCDLRKRLARCERVVSCLAAQVNPTETLSRQNHQLSPDGPIFHPQLLGSPDGMVAVIEVKAPSVPLEAAPSVQLYNYLDAILYHQRARVTVFGALWNGVQVRLFEATRGRDGEKTRFTRLCACDFNSDAGQRIFPFLLCSSHVDLGFRPPMIALPAPFGEVTLDAKRMLGRGQFSVGYEFSDSTEGECVLKHFPNPFAEQRVHDAWRREVEALTALATCPNVSRLVAAVENEAVLLKPRGRRFTLDARPTEAHVRDLVAAIQGVHTAGRYHGDITVDNIFFLHENSAFLNDFSHSEALPTDLKLSTMRRSVDLLKLIKALTSHVREDGVASWRIGSADGAAASLNYADVETYVIEALRVAGPNAKRGRDDA
jgi:hypothetical protein